MSTATLGLIQRQDPSLAAQLREDPASIMTQATRHKVYSTMVLYTLCLVACVIIDAGTIAHRANVFMYLYSTINKVFILSYLYLIRAGMLGQLASLQQWEEAMRRQDEM